jgi:hypothetical protein
MVVEKVGGGILEYKLNDGESTAIVAMLEKRNEVIRALDEYMEFLSDRHGMNGAVLQQKMDGLWLVVLPEEGGDADTDPDAEPD